MKFLETTSATPEDDNLDGFRMLMITNYRKRRPIFLRGDIINPDLYREEMLRFNQANLARNFKYSTGAWRLLNEKDGSDKKGEAETTSASRKLHLETNYCRTVNANIARRLNPVTGLWKLLGKGQSRKTPTLKKLQLESDKQKIMKLTNIKFLYKVSGDVIYKELGTGTLEAHINGFLFLCTDNNVHAQIVILYEKINAAFCLVEDQCMLPCLQFSLHDDIMVGTRRIKDIQFHWISETYGEAPLNFANRAQDAICRSHPIRTIRTCPFEKLHKESKFRGKLPYDDRASTFYVTIFSLVRLGKEASIMARLDEIEIVNLAEIVPGKIEMTVILKDFYRDILRINSIPRASLAVIKHRLDDGNVKFYENDIRLNWNEIVQNIIESPRDFIKNGTWNIYDLEKDSITLDYYSDSSHGE